jgi:AraC family transcriptional regulator
MIPLLIELGDNLDRDIDLGLMAEKYGLSPFHFHRKFSEAVRETPKKHIERLRLERAWYLLAVTDDPIVEISAATGYNSHETFVRAFKRRYGKTPSAYRALAKETQAARIEYSGAYAGQGCRLSDICFVTLRPAAMLALRRLGSYESNTFDRRAAAWDEILAWAGARGIACSDTRLGFFPDYPGMTPPDQMRADMAVPIDTSVPGDDRVRCLAFEGGAYGRIEFFGPEELVEQAYRKLAGAIASSKRFAIGEGAPLQIFRQTHSGGDPNANLFEIYIPARRIG